MTKIKAKASEGKVTLSSGDIGIVIIGRNEGERLTRCLQSLPPGNITVVYVDSGSTDGSEDNARKYGASVVDLDLSQPFTAARARNVGFRTLKVLQPKIKFVQFIDGDCSLVADWMITAQTFLLGKPNVAAVCGRRREINPEASIYNWLCDVEWTTPIGEAQSCGGDAMFRATLFEGSGGYRESLVAGEEPELCVRLRESGWKIWRIDAEMTRHDAAIASFSQWWRRCKRGGYGMIQVAILHVNSNHGIWKREIIRALIYAGIVPAVLLTGALYPQLLLSALFYPVQVCRIAIRRGANDPKSWKYGAMMNIAKFAELTGIVSFLYDSLLQKSRPIIEYK